MKGNRVFKAGKRRKKVFKILQLGLKLGHYNYNGKHYNKQPTLNKKEKQYKQTTDLTSFKSDIPTIF